MLSRVVKSDYLSFYAFPGSVKQPLINKVFPPKELSLAQTLYVFTETVVCGISRRSAVSQTLKPTFLSPTSINTLLLFCG